MILLNPLAYFKRARARFTARRQVATRYVNRHARIVRAKHRMHADAILDKASTHLHTNVTLPVGIHYLGKEGYKGGHDQTAPNIFLRIDRGG